MKYIKIIFKNFSKKKSIIIISGIVFLLTIVTFASNSNLNFKKSNELYYDLSYHYKKNNININLDNEMNILPMRTYQNEIFGLNKNLKYTTNTSFHTTKNVTAHNKTSMTNQINQTLYTKTNKDLIENAYKNLNPKKIAYLTFDDGPSKNTQRIIDVLSKNNVKGTFFFLGTNMEENPSIVKDVFEQGHSIGLHSYSHNYNQLYRKENGLIEDFNKAQLIYESITKEKTNIIRMPYGSKPTLKKEHIAQLEDNNYKFWDWNVDSNDSNSKGKNAEGIINTIEKSISLDMNNLVILMHEKEQTIQSLDTIIKMLKEAGYSIKPINGSLDAHNYWGIK